MFILQLPAVLGIELAGVVEAVGEGVTRLRQGDSVMGPLGGLGAYAELVAVNQANLALVPDALDFVQAAALPLASGAAWSSLHFAGPLHAAAVVFATARSSYLDYLRSLGADHVIACDQERFEDVASNIDLILDYAGGDAVQRSWPVLAAGGAIVSATAPDIAANTPAGQRGLWFVNAPDTARLQAIAEEVAQGRLQSKVGAVVRFEELPAAIERHRTESKLGKTVVTLLD